MVEVDANAQEYVDEDGFVSVAGKTYKSNHRDSSFGLKDSFE